MQPLKIVKHISFDDLKEKYRKTNNTKLAKKYLAILKMYEGKTVPQIAKELYITPEIVRIWVHRWNNLGPDGLKAKPQPGKPPILSKDEQQRLISDILGYPQEIGYNFSHWALKFIVGHIKKKYNKEISISGVDRMLKRHNFSRVVPRPMPIKANMQKKRIYRKERTDNKQPWS